MQALALEAGNLQKAMHFRTKTLNSAKLSTLRFASDVALRLVSTVVLTRLLAPEAYGVFAVVMVYLYLMEMFSDLGIRTLILTKEGEIGDDFLRTCWTVSIIRGLVIVAVSAAIAAAIGLLQGQGAFAANSSYAAPELPWALAAIGGAALISGLQSPVRYVRERNMEFGRVTVVYVITVFIGLIATIALAFYLRSIWALVLGNVIRNAIHCVLSFWAFPGPPMRVQLNRADIDIVVGRGKWIVGNSIMTGLSQSADRLMFGLVMSSATFGFYFIARQLVELMPRFLAALDAQIGLQIFTHIQKSTTADFRRNYYRYRLFFDAVAGLSAGGLVVLAPLLVEIVFDDRYGGVAPIVQILVPGMLLSGPLLLRSAYYAERRFRVMTLLGLVSTVTLWAGLAVAVFVVGSETAGLVVVALHRLPEAAIFTLMGWRRGWVVTWREFAGLVFCAVGALVGWGLLSLWAALT